jgi:hypothetical protein
VSKRISVNGKTFVVPDDATDDEITGIVDGASGKPAPAPNAGLAPPAGAPPKTLDSGEGPIAAGMTSMESQLSSIPGALWKNIKSSWMDKPLSDEQAGTSADSFVDPRNLNPVVHEQDSLPPDARAAAEKAGHKSIDWGATLGNVLPSLIDPMGGGITESPVAKIVGGAKAATGLATPKPIADMVSDTYSKTGDHISSALRSNTKVDVPAEAKIAAPAIEEGLNDRGISTDSFKGRNGPAALQAGIDNALDIHEARAKYAIDPIRGETVDPAVLAKNPDLAARFLDKDGNMPKKPITYGDLDAERIKMNKELRMGNFYSKPPSAQYAIQDPMAATHAAADQARDLVYGKVQDATGLDIHPLKRTESALIKLGDLAETTKNTLSPKEAQFNTTPLYKKIGGQVQSLLSVKANPINAFSIPEKPGLFNPLNEFNSHMQNAFPALKSAVADRTLQLPRYNLNLTPPAGSLPAPLQRAMHFTGGEQVPGESLKLTPPEGKTPPAPNAQEPLPFDGGTSVPATSTPDILGRGLIGGDMPLTPPGDMPPALQRVLGFENPGVPSELYPGATRPKK